MALNTVHILITFVIIVSNEQNFHSFQKIKYMYFYFHLKHSIPLFKTYTIS